MNQMFLLPPLFVRGIEATRERDRRDWHVYAIRNGYMSGQWAYPHKAEFESGYMKHLFQYAYRLAALGHAWLGQLPDMTGLLINEPIATAPIPAPVLPDSSRLLALPYADIAAAGRDAGVDPVP